MGEIRSTIDIIMEKTRGLTMTTEERKAVQKTEIEGKIRGLLQKYLDGVLDLKKLVDEVTAMEGERQHMALAALKEECRMFDPDGDATPYFKIFGTVLNVDTAPVDKALSSYQDDMDRLKRSWEARAMERLHRRGISGSALLPNLRADPAWMDLVSKEKAAFHEKISNLIK
jgi:hypothetical protein